LLRLAFAAAISRRRAITALSATAAIIQPDAIAIAAIRRLRFLGRHFFIDISLPSFF